jgi:hypothetical protein
MYDLRRFARETIPENNNAIHICNIFVASFIILATGTPINSLWKFTPLISSLLIILMGKPPHRHSRTLSCAALLTLSLAAAAIPLPTIEEGDNAFVPGYPQDAALAEQLPKEVYAAALQIFAAPTRRREIVRAQTPDASGIRNQKTV